MMRSKWLGNLMRILILAAGAGAGAALAFLCIQVHALTNEDPVALGTLVLLYGGMGALGALGAHLLSPRIMAAWHRLMGDVEKWADDLSPAQLMSMATWLIGSLLVAALFNQVLQFLGDGILTMALSAIGYVVMAMIGLRIGLRRADDMAVLLGVGRSGVKQGRNVLLNVADASVLMDGRIAALKRTGVIRGEWLTADFVIAQLQEMAESSDNAKRLRGQRGMETVRLLQADEASPLKVHTFEAPPADGDVALMALARERGATLLTADPTMSKAARVTGVPVVNLNEVALALRTVTAAGDVLTVRIAKEGREAGQGVGYLEDGTMVVVENTRHRMGETVEAVVTSVLQTSAGRMAFAKLKE